MALDNFITVTKANEDEFNALANAPYQGNSEETSPFQDGMIFKVDKADPVSFKRAADNSGRVHIVINLLRQDGERVEMWLSMLSKKGIETAVDKNNILQSDAPLNVKFRTEVEGKSLSNMERAMVFVNMVGDTPFRAIRQQFVRTARTTTGRTFTTPASLIGFELVA